MHRKNAKVGYVLISCQEEVKRAVRALSSVLSAVGVSGKEASHHPSDSAKGSLLRSLCMLSFLCVDHREGQRTPAPDQAVFM